MKQRRKPYFWVSWLTPLLVGEDNCEWKVWMKAHYQDLRKLPSDFDSDKWNENHTALLTSLRDEYTPKVSRILTEGQTSWKIEGQTAIVAGKMDLVTFEPNLVIDAKTGKQKDSHSAQMRIYLLAIELGAVPDVSGRFNAVLRYGDRAVDVRGPDATFKERFYGLVKRLAGPQMEPIPSFNECKYCDLADCESRYGESPKPLETVEF